MLRLENDCVIGSIYNEKFQEMLDVGEYFVVSDEFKEPAFEYLKKSNKPHYIFPSHCLFGTPGHNVVPALRDFIIRMGRY